MIVIKNATIYTPYHIIYANILINGRKISRISKNAFPRLSPETQIIDAKGKIVCPGFIDVHLQGAGGYDFLDGTREALYNISRTIAKFGVTSFLATTVFKKGKNPHIENLINRRSTGDKGPGAMGAQFLGIHLEGPFVNPRKKGMIRENGITECHPDYLNKILKACNGKLKMMTIAPELKGAIEIIKKLRKKNIIASLGHSDATFEEAQKGMAAGITHVTHIFNAMRPIHHRDPGPLAAILMDDNISVQLITDGVHIHPAVIKLAVRLKGVEKIVLITDSMSSLGLPDGKYIYDNWEYESRDGACRYKDGTLIGTALPLNKMIERMVRIGGVSLLDALKMATINPARVLGIENKKGSIEAGKDADLVIMNEDFHVKLTMVGGRVATFNESKTVPKAGT